MRLWRCRTRTPESLQNRIPDSVSPVCFFFSFKSVFDHASPAQPKAMPTARAAALQSPAHPAAP